MTSMLKKKILITGVHGFIGHALWQYLHKKQKNFEIFGLTSQEFSASGRLLHCDLRFPDKIKSALQRIRPDYIFHFAGGRSKNQKEQIRLNCRLTKNLFETIKTIKNFSPRIIVPGSAAEYGIPKAGRLIQENDPLHPVSAYGKAKRRQTQMVLQYARQGFDVIIARIFNILGEGTPARLAAGNFACQIAMIEKRQRQPVIQTESLAGGRDFLDIEDICAAVFCLMKDGKSGEIYNICSGKKIVTRELLKRLRALSKVKNITTQENETKNSSAFDVIGSNAKIKLLKRWRPKVSLEQSLRNTLETYRSSAKGGSLPDRQAGASGGQ